MATTRRRRSHAIAHANASAPLSLKARIARAATGPAATTLYVTIGTVGLAALGIAIFGPKRFNRQVVQPVRQAVGDQAERLWADSGPLRAEIGKLFDRAQSPSGREKLVRSFQSWVGHFRAT